MPELLSIFSNRWKMILTITLLATVLATIVSVLSPKKYLAVATALPANTVTADKARIFNTNIEALYSEFGSPDDLDRMEGTAALDTIFIAAASEFGLANYYSIDGREALYKAAMRLKKSARINRSSYGQLKVKVWDKEPTQAAAFANFLMNKIHEIHRQLVVQINRCAVEALKNELASKQQTYSEVTSADTAGSVQTPANMRQAKLASLADQILSYEKLIDQYQLSIKTDVPVLLVVENARPPLTADKPNTVQTLIFVFVAAFAFSFLMALFLESRKHLT